MTRDNDTERNKQGGSQTAWLDVSEKSVGCSGTLVQPVNPLVLGTPWQLEFSVQSTLEERPAQGALETTGSPEGSAEDSVHRRFGKEPPNRIRGNIL